MTIRRCWEHAGTCQIVLPSGAILCLNCERHPPPRHHCQKHGVLQVFGAESRHDDGEGHLLDLNSEVNQEQAEELQRPGQDVDALLVHQGAVTVAHGEADESHHAYIT